MRLDVEIRQGERRTRLFSLPGDRHARLTREGERRMRLTRTIELDDRFLSRVVPSILQNSPEIEVENPSDLLAAYLRINRFLRRINDAAIAAAARETARRIYWQGPFKQFLNTAVAAGLADQRTYYLRR